MQNVNIGDRTKCLFPFCVEFKKNLMSCSEPLFKSLLLQPSYYLNMELSSNGGRKFNPQVNEVFFCKFYSPANNTTKYLPKVVHEYSFDTIMVFFKFYHALCGD